MQMYGIFQDFPLKLGALFGLVSCNDLGKVGNADLQG